MLGTIVNCLAIIVGAGIGLCLRGGLEDRYSRIIMSAIGLAVILIGLKAAFKAENLLPVIICLVAGSFIGELLNIESRLEKMGRLIEGRMAKNGKGFTQGFVTASLVYCVGAMAIVGSLESGLAGNHQTLFAKSILDGVTAVIFSASLGIGVMFSALSVFLYQGTITLGAGYLKTVMTPEVVTQVTSVGGLLITAIGFNLLRIQNFKIGNMLPALFLPLVYNAIVTILN